jgi:DNA-binding transcriptional MerR regulator
MGSLSPEDFRLVQRPLCYCRGKRKMMKIVKADIDAANNNDVSATDGYTRIGELAKKYGVTLRTLRFYEDKGLLSPHRDGTTRLYTRRDVARLKLILLGRKVGFSLREVKQMLDLYDPTGSNTKQLKLTLDKSEKQLVRLEKQRTAIDEAIVELTGMIGVVRSMLAERQPARAASS